MSQADTERIAKLEVEIAQLMDELEQLRSALWASYNILRDHQWQLTLHRGLFRLLGGDGRAVARLGPRPTPVSCSSSDVHR